ncbi:hypothetical protein DEM27_07430 [Metarhizobium album]|uniref:Amidohydrolase-related domain-containing protein n=1 Tax=Metarhizobium album TaxID=2182425 RepID=A0A2U2DVW2_9HYPH|nr:hypothetical protein [Rhizobium album]PWE57450.1 hypothetical protein DEM27_07430 [Rhizobium album]
MPTLLVKNISHLAPGMSADVIAIDRSQLGLSGTQRDPLAALVMCGPFKADYSYINGRQIIGSSEFRHTDVESLLAKHQTVMDRIYSQ